jgi:hypothetical protein
MAANEQTEHSEMDIPLKAIKYNPDTHHRRSLRLKGYDYEQAGAYFVTVCTQERACLFGDVPDGELQLKMPVE